LAGLLAGLVSAGIVLYEMLVERLFAGFDPFLDRYWLRMVLTEALLLVITGLLAGAVAQRWPDARQVTAGSA
jgi:hypothetical protein